MRRVLESLSATKIADASRPAAQARLRCSRLRRRLVAVAEAEVGVDVDPAGRSLLELLAHLADEDVDRAVAVGHPVAPDLLVDLLAREDLAHRARQQAQDLEFAAREVEALV